MNNDLSIVFKPEYQNYSNWYGNYKDDSEKNSAKQSLTIADEKEKFSNQKEYILSVLGYLAGFGSIWRFPYLIFKNGGGVFLIPYLILFFIIGIPSFYFETALGQTYLTTLPQIFQQIHKKWKGLGFLPVFNAITMSTYYNLILAYSFYYLWESFKFPLPWKIDNQDTFQQPWNKDYFYKEVLNISDSISDFGTIVWPLFWCYIFSQIIVFLCIQKGIQLSGKIALITATSPFVLLILLFIRGLFLEGSYLGIMYLLSPDWSKLFKIQVWVDAANQVIFQLGFGCAALVFYGVHRPQSQKIKEVSIIIPSLAIGCGLLASLVVFQFLGYMSKISNVQISEIPLAGPELAFIVFPAVLTQMPLSNIFSVIFFCVLILLGIDTQFSFLDCVSSVVLEEILSQKKSKIASKVTPRGIRGVICCFVAAFAFIYCRQNGFHFLTFIDNYGVGVNLLASIAIEVGFFFWMYDWGGIEYKIWKNVGEKTPNEVIWLLKYAVTFLACFLAFLAFLLQIQKSFAYPFWDAFFGWVITLYPYFIILYFYKKYNKENEQNIVQS